MASLLVGALIAAAVVIVTPVWDRPSDESSAPATDAGVRVDLERRIADFTTDMVATARYAPPDRTERETVAEGVALYVDGRHEAAVRKLAEVDFGVRILTDTADGSGTATDVDGAKGNGTKADGSGRDRTDGNGTRGRRFAEIADRAAEARRGWGRVYVALDAPAGFSVQVPHPVADAYSDTLGVGVLRGAPGGVLVIAGTHRTAGEGDAADVAHRRDTVFHAVCAELVTRRMPGIQVHGFADGTSPAHDLIVSTGAGAEGRPQAVTLARALADDGFAVCRAWSGRCPLAGRTNKQGLLATAEGVPFLHVEVSRTVRADPSRSRGAIAAMTTAVGGWRP
ncbi:hypothetical protein [Streptomyces sp. NPDC058280]|uniref:hypothetical protein n=1 Tax=Streptomyces sp. NPDC058280 TaxID=3346419 RepID=UPI0036E88139